MTVIYHNLIRKGREDMNEHDSINRADYLLLSTLYASECMDYFHSMTISEIIDDNSDEHGNHPLGARMTVYRKLQRLVDLGYIKKGITDDHSDTYYLDTKSIGLMKDGGIKA